MVLGAAVVALSGCTCGSSAAVPFRGGEQPSLRPQDPAAGLLPLEAAVYVDGTRALSIEEQPLRIDEGSIRASALFDFDRDGDRDVLLVVLDAPSAAARVLYGERRGEALAPLVSLASQATFAPEVGAAVARVGETAAGAAAGAAVCAATSASVTPLSDALVLVSVEARCEDAASPRLTTAWVLTADERPRALEHFAWWGRAEGEGLSFAAHDRDQDGHDDLELEVRVATSGEPITTTLTWMSRAAGLAREGDQPEPTLSALAGQAREQLRRNPDESLAITERAIALRDAVCREAERPRLAIGGTRGLSCGASTSIGRLYAMRAASLVRRLRDLSDVPAVQRALAAYIEIDHQGVAVREGDRALVREAWLRLSSVPPTQLVVHRAEQASPLDTRTQPRLSSLAFLDEHRLLVRGASPRVWRVADDTLVADTTAAPPPQLETRIVEPGGARELVAIERTCEGTTVVTVPVGGLLEGGARRDILVAQRPAPAAAPCTRAGTLPEGHRADDGGYVALGWAPSGLVLARGAEVTFVPLDAAGAPAGPPSVLDAQTPLPAPLAVGAAVADARGYAFAFPFGIVVVDRAERAVRVFHDRDFAVPQGRPIDVALAPSLSRAAWLCGGAICWAELRAHAGVAALPPEPTEPPEPPPELAAQQAGLDVVTAE